MVYLNISIRLAVKKLPNGENAHCTVKQPDWWMNLISKHAMGQLTEVSFQAGSDTQPIVHSLPANK